MTDRDDTGGCAAILIGIAALSASVAVGIAWGPGYGFVVFALLAFMWALALLRGAK